MATTQGGCDARNDKNRSRVSFFRKSTEPSARSAMQLKHPLREVDADNRNFRHGYRSFLWPAEGR